MGRFSFALDEAIIKAMQPRNLIKALRQGSGKAYFLVQEDPAGAVPILLRFMDEPISNDIQSNGTHANYLYGLLKLCPDFTVFERKLLETKRYSLRNQDLFEHRVELLGLFARDGFLQAMNRLVDLYRFFVKKIYLSKGDYPFYFFGDFESLLLALTIDGHTFIRVGKDMLRLMEEGRIEFADIDWYLMSQCMEYEQQWRDNSTFKTLYSLCKKDIALIKRQEKMREWTPKRPLSRSAAVSLKGLSEEEALEALPLFIKGASASDSSTILNHLKKLDYDYRRDLAHPAIMSIAHNERLSKRVYRFAYDRSFCSGCRKRIFFIMEERGFLDIQMLREACHDCDEEVAKTAANLLKLSQN